MDHRSSALVPDMSMLDRFQLLLEHSSDAIAEFDQTLHYVCANQVWADFLGLPVSELLNTTNEQLALKFSHLSHSASLCAEFDRTLRQVLETGNSLRIIHTSGVEAVEVAYTLACAEEDTWHIFAVGRVLHHVSSSSIGAIDSMSRPEVAQGQSLSSQEEPVSSGALSAIVGVEMPGMETSSVEDAILDEWTKNGEHGESGSMSVSRLDRPVTPLEQQQADLIRNSTEFLQLVLDSIPQYIFWKDRNSVYLGCNRRWAEMSGIGEPDRVIGITDVDLPWTDEQKAWYIKCDRQVMETGVPMLGIKQSQRQANGQITWRETSKIPIRNTQGEVIGLLGMIEDVTERKQAEDLLKQSKETYRKLAKREEILNRLSSQIRNSLDLETILQTVVREVRQFLDTDRVVVYEFDEIWRGTVVVEDVVPPWISTLGELGADNCFPDQFAELYEQGRVRAIANIQDSTLDACHKVFLEKLQVKANLIVPILINQKLWGLLIAHSCREPRDWQETEMDLLKYLAEQIGVAIRQGQLYAQAKESAQRSQTQAQQLELSYMTCNRPRPNSFKLRKCLA